MLDVKTGIVRQYPVSSKKSILTLNPYGVAVDPQGMIWFTEASTDSIGRLDPTSGNVRNYVLPGPVDPLMEIASDADGIIWATSFNAGLLVRLKPRTGTFTRYYVPASDHPGALYGLLVTSGGEIWITISTENVIARLDIAANHFFYYRIPTASSLPFGLVTDANHTLWFTEAGSNKIGMLKL
jgi:virginiamycin B lyase